MHSCSAFFKILPFFPPTLSFFTSKTRKCYLSHRVGAEQNALNVLCDHKYTVNIKGHKIINFDITPTKTAPKSTSKNYEILMKCQTAIFVHSAKIDWVYYVVSSLSFILFMLIIVLPIFILARHRSYSIGSHLLVANIY